MKYEDMVIEATDFERIRTEDKRRLGSFKVRVLQSPAGEMKAEDAVPVQYDLSQLAGDLERLELRTMDRQGLVDLGRTLAVLLLPPAEEGSVANIRGLFADSLQQAGQETGLRLRLRLPPALAVIPWEYMYVDRAGGGDGMDGFLALDPRVAIMRHETLTAPAPVPVVTGNIRVVAALASHMDLPELDLARERADLEATFADQAGMDVSYLEDATLDEIQAAMPGASVFHFAGHGAFTREMGDVPGTYSGTGYLALDDQFVDAETLGLNLRGNGVRLAVLGGCETGRREQVSVWSGIAPALVKAEVPAVIANQYEILDECAIAFSRQFYRALVGGLPIERAVSAGRIAAFNADREERDWGVPVLYLRAKDGELFAGVPDAGVRQQARENAEANVNLRLKEVAAGGEVLGAEVRQMLAGKLNVDIDVSGTVFGGVVGAKIDTLGGGSADVGMDIDTVGEGGQVTGARIDSLG